MKKLIFLPVILLIISAAPVFALSIEKLSLPPGFGVEVYAEGLETARGMAFSDKGTLFVGSKNGNVYAVTPQRDVKIVARGLSMPVGLDFHGGDLWVSEISRIIRLKNIESNLDVPPKPQVVNDTFPKERSHGWKFIKIGPDNKLYVPVGAPCNVCLRKDRRFASIMRMDPDGRNLEMFAEGVRNTVGFDWHPDSGELWFTDNGRDLMGDNLPPDEINRATQEGLHFGFPFLHGRSVEDPVFWNKRPQTDFTLPEYELPAHVAALGMRFYTGSMFPEYYRNGIFVAEHGSWNRSRKIGYRVSFIKLRDSSPLVYETFVSGWLVKETAWGRPVDVEIGPDGALYVSDDRANCVYRIYYEK